MKLTKLFAFSAFLLIGLNLQAQISEKPQNEFGVTSFRLETNSETMHQNLAPKLVAGIYYNRIFSNWSWVSAADYADNVIEDYCPSCRDANQGKGELTEYNASSALRYTLWGKKRFLLKPYMETGVYYSHIRYAGTFSGGWGGQQSLDYTTQAYGIIQSIGLSFNPFSKLIVSASSYVRMGYGPYKNLMVEHEKINGSSYGTAIQFRIGYILN